MKKLIIVLMLSIGFTTAVNAGGYTPKEIQEDRPAWNHLTNQWEMLDCDTDTDCEQKYGEEPVHQLDDTIITMSLRDCEAWFGEDFCADLVVGNQE